MLFKIGNTDYTDYIQESSYKVDETNIYNEWEDANYTSHKDVLRKKVIGSFDIVFVIESEASEFISAINNTNSNGAIVAEMLISNKNAVEEKECFCTISTTKREKISESYTYQRFVIGIEER